jgi:hypothetical protein
MEIGNARRARNALGYCVSTPLGPLAALEGDTESFYYKAGQSRTQESNPAFTLTFSHQRE